MPCNSKKTAELAFHCRSSCMVYPIPRSTDRLWLLWVYHYRAFSSPDRHLLFTCNARDPFLQGKQRLQDIAQAGQHVRILPCQEKKRSLFSSAIFALGPRREKLGTSHFFTFLTREMLPAWRRSISHGKTSISNYNTLRRHRQIIISSEIGEFNICLKTKFPISTWTQTCVNHNKQLREADICWMPLIIST